MEAQPLTGSTSPCPFPATDELLPLGVLGLRAEATIVGTVLCTSVMSRPAVRQTMYTND